MTSIQYPEQADKFLVKNAYCMGDGEGPTQLEEQWQPHRSQREVDGNWSATTEPDINGSVDTRSWYKTKRERCDITLPTSSKRLRHDAAHEYDMVQLGSKALKQGRSKAEIAELIVLGQSIHRKKCRENQRRFRKKQNDWIDNMDTTTKKLRTEVAILEMRRSRITQRLLDRRHVWNVAAQYFLLFRHGIALGSQFTREAATQFNNQLSFVQAMITDGVVSSAGFGPETLMRTWSFSQSFDDVKVELESLQDDKNLLKVSTKTSVAFTTQTLRNLFPLLYNATKGSGAAILTDQLLGQRIVMRGSTCFEWDDAAGRVSSVIAQSDMLTPLLRLLGSLEEVARVFEAALICPDFRMR